MNFNAEKYFAGNYNSYVHERLEWEVSSKAPGPRFTSASNVTVFTYSGATTHIDCAVEMVSQDTVISWVRRRDLHILTIATITYTADRRWTSIIIKPLMLSSALFTVKQ